MRMIEALRWRLSAIGHVRLVGLLFCFGAFALTSTLHADTFGSGANSFNIAFVPIGNSGNPADTTGNPNPAGSVSYLYRIGKYEISEQMVDKANALGGLGITKDTRGPDKPATSVTWFEAARFTNWLNTSTGHAPAYKFDVSGNFQLWGPADPGYDPNNLFRNSLAKYFLPSANEWYKAAFYDSVAGIYWDYPTGSNSFPVTIASGTSAGSAVLQQGLAGPADITQAGGLSAYGTMAQGGNVAEWEETALDLINNDPLELRGGRGGNWDAATSTPGSNVRSASSPMSQGAGGGFRIASIAPEPQVATMLVIAVALTHRRARQRFRSLAA
jgi:sulfatase modifying factor 1